MAWWTDLAEQHPGTPNHGGPMVEQRGMVEHTAVGTYLGTIAWQMNSAASVSSHFVVAKDGRCSQMLDTTVTAWTQRLGNGHWVSIENEGDTLTPLTAAQIEKNAQLFARGHREHGWLLQLATAPSGRGLGHHSMGAENGVDWGHSACLPLDTTEVLTPTGWVLLADATLSTPVASLAIDSGILGFAPPVGIVEPYTADLVDISGFEMTPDHRLYVAYPRKPFKVIEARELERFKPWPSVPRTDLRIPAFGDLATSGLGIGPDLMRLLVWVQADGHYQLKDGRLDHLHFHFAKQRKVQRVSEILDLLGKDFRVSERSDGTTVVKVYGVEWLERNVLRWMPNKAWGPWLMQADAAEFEAVDEEITSADGHEPTGQQQRFYFSSQRTNADAVQALYVTHGRSASVYSGANGQWTVNLHTRRQHGHSLTFVQSRSGVQVGCVTTVDDTLLIRQNGRVAVVGNCPGALIKAQKPAILARAIQLASGTTPPTGDDMTPLEAAQLNNAEQYAKALVEWSDQTEPISNTSTSTRKPNNLKAVFAALAADVAAIKNRPQVTVDAAAVAAALAGNPAFLAGVAKAVNDDAAKRLAQ